MLAEKDLEIQRLRSELYSLQGVQESPLLSRKRSLDRSTSVGSVSSSVHEGIEGASSLPVDVAAAASGSSNTGPGTCMYMYVWTLYSAFVTSWLPIFVLSNT